MQFALLEHDQTPAGAALAERDVHWDLLLEIADQERLPTWRLAANPVDADQPIAAERIQDHRRVYLDYEGEVSGGRGVVRRLDRGDVQALHLSGDAARFTLAGELLRGTYRIDADADGGLVFRALS